jgi:hypothetical protein
MRDDTHGFTSGFRQNPYPRKPFDVMERVRVPGAGGAQRSDTRTSSLRYAMDRRTELVRQGRPAFVLDADGRRVEVARW